MTTTSMNRSALNFLGCLLLLAWLPRLPAEDAAAPLRRFEFTRPQMGMPFRMVFYAPDDASAQAAADAAFDRIRRLNDCMSDYDDESELSALSRSAGSGKPQPVGADLWEVLSRAQALGAASGGAFDVTVGPCVRLWRKARREKQWPDPAALEAARRSVGYEKLSLDAAARTALLRVPGMKLDLGAIAKGYAVDEAMKVLKQRGIRHALVGGAGDMAVSAPPPGRTAWRIELSPLEEDGSAPQFIHLTHAAVATSGDMFQHVELDGKRYSHIVDPRTGLGLAGQSIVFVIAPDCMTADSLSTTVSVLGPEKGLKLAEGVSGTAVKMVRKNGERTETFESPGFARHDREP